MHQDIDVQIPATEREREGERGRERETVRREREAVRGRDPVLGGPAGPVGLEGLAGGGLFDSILYVAEEVHVWHGPARVSMFGPKRDGSLDLIRPKYTENISIPPVFG